MADLNLNIHDLFDTWTEISAYIFGFWLSDGCIRLSKHKNRYYKRWCLNNTDEQIMKDISLLLDCSCSKYSNGCFEISKNSEKLFDFCYSIVGDTKKSLAQFKLPVINQAKNHFLRGFFDGDGSIFWVNYRNRHGKQTKNLRTSLTAGLETNHLEQIQEMLTEIGIKRKIVKDKRSKKIQMGQYDSTIFCDFIYQDATLFMKRKRLVYDEADKNQLKASLKFCSKEKRGA